jgi:dTDP-4-amino-4,6-dideoxygalactose transaminase
MPRRFRQIAAMPKAPDAACPSQRLPVAKQLGETAFDVPVHPTLSDDDMHDTADAMARVLAVAAETASGI